MNAFDHFLGIRDLRVEMLLKLIVIGTSSGVMVSKVDQQTYTIEFEFHWVPPSFGHVLHQSRERHKLLKFISVKLYTKRLF